ncbi:hypothetical protein I4U23_004044 [Adineta vaga]|nr:hypothetical protein I4U23_004044 [Adineta vaga]
MENFSSFPSELLQKIFIEINSFSDLLRVSSLCKRFRLIIYDEYFLNKYFQQRFRYDRSHRNLIGYWKFDDENDIGKDSSLVKPNYYLTSYGHAQPSLAIRDCEYFHKCIEFDGRTRLNFTVHDKSEYQIDYFSISLWLSPDRQSLHQHSLKKPPVSNGKGINHPYPLSDPIYHAPWQMFLCAWQHDINKNWILMCIDHYNTVLSEAIVSDNQCSFYCSTYERLEEEKWYHIVTRHSRDKQEVWINGRFCGQTDMTTPKNIAASWRRELSESQKRHWDRERRHTPYTLTLGAKNEDGQDPFHGRMADLSIWSRWLTPVEIRTISEQKKPIDQIQVGTYIIDYSS